MSTQKVEYGKSAVVPKTVPKKPSDEYYTYTFEGWDTTYDYTKVTANLSIAPKFKATLETRIRKRTVGGRKMNCRLVFFAARKTSFCERALQKSFSELDLELVKTCFATDSEQLGNELTDAFKKLNAVFVVGGLGFDDEKGIKA